MEEEEGRREGSWWWILKRWLSHLSLKERWGITLLCLLWRDRLLYSDDSFYDQKPAEFDAFHDHTPTDFDAFSAQKLADDALLIPATTDQTITAASVSTAVSDRSTVEQNAGTSHHLTATLVDQDAVVMDTSSTEHSDLTPTTAVEGHMDTESQTTDPISLTDPTTAELGTSALSNTVEPLSDANTTAGLVADLHDSAIDPLLEASSAFEQGPLDTGSRVREEHFEAPNGDSPQDDVIITSSQGPNEESTGTLDENRPLTPPPPYSGSLTPSTPAIEILTPSSTKSPSRASRDIKGEPLALDQLERGSDIGDGMPRATLRPRGDSRASSTAAVAGNQTTTGKAKSGKASGSVRKSNLKEKAAAKKGATKRRDKASSSKKGAKKVVIDDTISEMSYQPDTDLSSSKAIKKAFSELYTVTVEPLNNVTFGTSYSVHYREVPFFGGYKCVSTIGK